MVCRLLPSIQFLVQACEVTIQALHLILGALKLVFQNKLVLLPCLQYYKNVRAPQLAMKAHP